MTATLAIFATIILSWLALFQVALAAGAHLGKFAWGGQHAVLPTGLRIASAFSIVLYTFFSYVILVRADALDSPLGTDFITTSTWVVTGYFGLGILMNAISRSKPERLVMTPIVLILFVLYLLVAMSP